MQQPTQSGLPFPADRLMRNPISINPQAPLFIPQVNALPEAANAIPLLTGMAMLYIETQMTSNYLRVFGFNVLGRDYYRNNEFAQFMQIVVDYFAFYVKEAQSRNTQPDPTQAVQESISKSIDYFLSLCVSKYPSLSGYLTNEQQQRISAVLSEYGQFINITRSMYTQATQIARPGFSGSVNVGNNMMPTSLGNTPTPTQGSIFQAGPSTLNINPTVNKNSFGSRYDDIDESVFSATTHQSPSHFSSEQHSFTKETNMTPSHHATPHPEEFLTSNPLLEYHPAKTSPLVFIPNKEVPYPPFVKRSEKELFVRQEFDSDGVAFVRFSVAKRSEDSMFDYDTHTTLTQMGVHPSTRERPSRSDIEHAQQRIMRSLEERENVIEDNSVAVEFAVNKRNTYTFVGSLESLIMDNEIARNTALSVEEGKEQVIHVFGTNAFMIESLGELTSREKDILDGFKVAETFMDLVRELKIKAPRINKRAWRTIERRMTRIVNYTLRQQLSTEMTIDSFVMDMEELLDVLAQTAPLVHSRLIQHESAIIKNALCKANDEMIASADEDNESPVSDCLSSAIMGGPSTILVSEASCYWLNIDSEELDIELYKNVGNTILPPQSKLLFNLSLFIKSQRTSNDPLITDYVILSDGVVLAMNNGLIGTDFVVVSIAK